jgi:hypothetical protein
MGNALGLSLWVVRSVSLYKQYGWLLVAWSLGLAAAACQSQGGSAGGIPTPTIGTLPGITHQDRITLIGDKYAGTGIFIDSIERVPRDNGTLWTAVIDLQEGLNTFEVDAMDEHGYISDPLSVTIRLDTTAPAVPTISAPPSTPSNPVPLSGTKDPGTFLRLNGRRISALNDSTTWEYQATLASGSNTLRVTAVDAAGNESALVEPVVTLTTPSCAAPPHPVFPLDGDAVTWGTAFSWTQPVPAASYVFELSATPAFTLPLVVRDEGIVSFQWVPTRVEPGNSVYYWRVGAVDPCGTSYSKTRRVVVGSTTGDVTGDGFADVLVGANGNNRADIDAGAVYLYKGGAVARTVFDAVLTGKQRGATFGSSVAKVGDIDRDGFVDFLVGAPREDQDSSDDDDTGAAYLYWGGPTLDPTPAVIFRGEEPRSYFGISVAGVGDVNGDGYPDVAIGGHQTDVTALCGGVTTRLLRVGRVYVYFGGPRDQMDNLPDVVLTGETTEIPNDLTSPCRTGDEFGLSVAGAGDVNGDGYDDIAIGARGFDVVLTALSDENTGHAYVFFGGPWFVGVGAERANAVLTGLTPGDQFGASVAIVGDVNGDGFADAVVGSYGGDSGGSDSGAAALYFGRGSGMGPVAVQMSGAAAGDGFGNAVARVGDLNGDGFADFVIGAHLAGPDDNGAAYFFLGNSGSTPTTAGTITGEPDPDDLHPGVVDPGFVGYQFGVGVAGAGDFNHDGNDDVVVGAPFYDLCTGVSAVCDNAGGAYVIMGPSIGNRVVASDSSDRVFPGANVGDGMGAAVN